MQAIAPKFSVRLAQSPKDVQAAQRLRYDVFVEELGGSGADVDHDARLEIDRFDAFVDHLLLQDHAREGAPVVGVYRLLREDAAQSAGQFYSEDEYDLTLLRQSGLKLLELGRSCVHPDYRGGTALFQMWQGLADYVADHEIQVLFGVASFHGTDPQELAHPLSQLHERYLAPEALRVRARQYQPMNLVPSELIDRKRAAREMPSLIKSYLRLGGCVGDGAFVDQAFNTTDVCLVLDTARLNERQRAMYSGARS